MAGCTGKAGTGATPAESATETATPLRFESHTVDLGHVLPGETCDAVFSFANKSNELVIIDELDVSCGCTEAIPSTKRVLPGEEGTVRINFRVPDNSDPVAHSVKVDFHATHEYSTQLFLHADPEWPAMLSDVAKAAGVGLVIGLAEMIDPDIARAYDRKGTGQKYLVDPSR